MKIILLISGVFSLRWCFAFLGENSLNFFWLLPLIILLGIGLAWISLKILSEFLEIC
jgi:hypothetical protein